MTFDWDPDKEAANRRRHGLGFEEAVRVFEREAECLEIFDEDHSTLEERFITIGPVASGLVLVVWTERDVDVVRVISARYATVREQELFRSHMERRR